MARAVLVLALAMAPATAFALAVHGDTESTCNPPAHTQRPDDDPGWDYVGQTGAGAAVYLGNGYILAPRHFTPNSSVNFPVGSFALDTTFPAVNLANPNPGEGAPDLRVFRILDPPALAPLPIAETSPTAGEPGGAPATDLLLIACGRTRNTPLQPFNDRYGYGTSIARRRVWGVNTVSLDSSLTTMGGHATYAFRSSFEARTGEAQAVDKDSGGGVFVFNGDQDRWELAGMIIGAVPYDGNLTRALFGNQVIMADLSVYRDQLLSFFSQPPLAGDADGDGDVDLDDFVAIKNHFGTAGNATWADGDFDGDGDVDLDDFVILKNNFGASAP
ncbi:MAG: hypothetical protein GX591_09360 [Planctomycetes bacterium]|nr:hypothetical protein [Planctomycetota bacterium]